MWYYITSVISLSEAIIFSNQISVYWNQTTRKPKFAQLEEILNTERILQVIIIVDNILSICILLYAAGLHLL